MCPFKDFFLSFLFFFFFPQSGFAQKHHHVIPPYPDFSIWQARAALWRPTPWACLWHSTHQPPPEKTPGKWRPWLPSAWCLTSLCWTWRKHPKCLCVHNVMSGCKKQQNLTKAHIFTLWECAYRARKRQEVARGTFPQARVVLIYRQWKQWYTDRTDGARLRRTKARRIRLRAVGAPNRQEPDGKNMRPVFWLQQSFVQRCLEFAAAVPTCLSHKIVRTGAQSL